MLRKCLMMPLKCFLATWESSLVFKVISNEAMSKLINNMIARVKQSSDYPIHGLATGANENAQNPL